MEAGQVPDVRLTVAVADEINGLPKAQADAVRDTIKRIGQDVGEPVDLPDAPPGTEYLALTPVNREAPVVIYRPMLPKEDGDWLVTSLIAPDQYKAWQRIVRAALENPALTATAATAAWALIRALTRAARN